MKSIGAALVPDVVRKRWAVKVGIAVLVVLVAIAGVGLFTYVTTNEQLTEDTRYRMETAAETQATALGDWISQMKREAHSLAYAAPVQSGDTQRISTHLQRELEGGHLPDDVLAVHYVDTETAEYRASSSTAVVGTNAQQVGAPWAGELPDLGADESYVSAPFVHEGRETPVLGVVSAVPNQENRALVLVIDLQSRSGDMSRPVRQSFTKVVDDTGTTVLSHRTDQILDQNMGGQDVEGVDSMAVKKGLEGQSGYMEMEMGGELMTMGFAPVDGTDWVLMTHSPKSTIFALQHQISRNLLVLLGTALLGFGLIGATVGRNTVRALTRLSSRANALESGDLDVELTSDRIDEIGQLNAAFRSMRDSLRERIREAEAQKQRSDELVEHLERKADDYSRKFDRAANGTLTVRLDPESESSAMTEIAESFNAMITTLESTVTDVRSFADEVVAASEEVTAGTEESRTASEQVSQSIQEISADAETQSENVREVADEMQQLSGTIQEVASSADEMASTSERTAELGRRGRESAAEAMDEMSAIDAQVDATIEEVETLADDVDGIGDIVAVIDDIAEQTNMLALNASIEAEQAGEDGDGFAVVADEIKQLAEEVSDATGEVEALVTEVESSTDTTVRDIRDMGERISSGTRTIEGALEALEEMAANVEDADQRIQEITRATDEQATSTEEVASRIDDMTDAAEQVSVESDNVSAAAEEQASSLTQVAQSAGALAEQADQLQEQLDHFTVSQAAEPTTGGRTTSDRDPGTVPDGGTASEE